MLVNETDRNMVFRSVSRPPNVTEENANKLYYFLQGGVSGSPEAFVDSVLYGIENEASKVAEFRSIDMDTREAVLLYVWFDVEVLGGFFLSDLRTIVAMETPEDVSFWALDNSNHPEHAPQLVHQMNTTLYDRRQYWYPRYNHLDYDKLVWNGYDDQHGQ